MTLLSRRRVVGSQRDDSYRSRLDWQEWQVNSRTIPPPFPMVEWETGRRLPKRRKMNVANHNHVFHFSYAIISPCCLYAIKCFFSVTNSNFKCKCSTNLDRRSPQQQCYRWADETWRGSPMWLCRQGKIPLANTTLPHLRKIQGM